jgi:hypothetical protein
MQDGWFALLVLIIKRVIQREMSEHVKRPGRINLDDANGDVLFFKINLAAHKLKPETSKAADPFSVVPRGSPVSR